MKTKKKSNLRWGFKTEANEYAREFRKELGLNLYDPLCPWTLAKHLAIPVISLSQIKADIGEKHYNYVTRQETSIFSGVTIFHGSRRLIIFNDAHLPYRQASNVAHELSHGILGHQPSEVFDQIGCRHFDPVMEEEANWLAPALLISEEAALHIVRERMDEEQASQFYRVSKEVIRMRLNVTGARNRVKTQRS